MSENSLSGLLVGNPEEVKSVAALQGVTLPEDLQIIDPEQVRDNYVAPMVELRKHKGVTPQMAHAMLEDNVVLATMMVALDEVDGLVFRCRAHHSQHCSPGTAVD